MAAPAAFATVPADQSPVDHQMSQPVSELTGTEIAAASRRAQAESDFARGRLIRRITDQQHTRHTRRASPPEEDERVATPMSEDAFLRKWAGVVKLVDLNELMVEAAAARAASQYGLL